MMDGLNYHEVFISNKWFSKVIGSVYTFPFL
jgi:hypothetical protein